MNNKINNELSNLLDEVAEEARLGNLRAEQIRPLINLVMQKHDECLKVLDEYPDADVDDIVRAYRALIRQVLHKN